MGYLFRGPRNVIPGMIMFSLFGFAGQHAYNALDSRHIRKVQKQMAYDEERARQGNPEEPNWMQRLAKKKWSPMTALSDEEYEKILSEQLLRIETDIALVDERIKELGEEKRKAELSKSPQTQEKAQK